MHIKFNNIIILFLKSFIGILITLHVDYLQYSLKFNDLITDSLFKVNS